MSRGKVLVLTILVMLVSACGYDTSPYLSIDIYGVYSVPTGATGDTSPQNMTLTLTDISVVNQDASGQESFFSGSSQLVVIDRPLQILEKDLTNYEDETFSQIILTFDTSFALDGQDFDTIAGDLSSGTLSYSVPLTIETGKSYSFSVKISWQNIIQDGAITANPSFEIVKD